MKLQFIGATHEVTGSCTLLEIYGRYFLIDCGMEQGIDVFQNISLPINPSEIEAVFLTHAHIDHSGMLPKLYKDGFCGKVYATDVTCDLCNIMLRDSAHIQEMEAKWRSKRARRSGGDIVEPVYTVSDALGVLSHFRRCNYGEMIFPSEGIELRFTDIGHLLGSACIELWLTEGDTTKKIVFSGDVGNTNQGIIRDPSFVSETDYLVIESTYGNRVHQKQVGNVVEMLADYIQKTLDRGGNVIIPSFAVGRTQEILYMLREIKDQRMVKGHTGFPVYVDSPLASEATSIFMQCNRVCFDDETLSLLNKGINPIWFKDIKITESSDESKLINMDTVPKVIISASGMCEAGRIRHHLKHNLWRKECLILFVGYQSEGSLGRKLLNGEKRVSLFGEEITVNAEIGSLSGTSGHADQNGLLNWLSGFSKKTKTVFVNHGDNDSCEDFKNLLIEKGYDAIAPYSGTEYDLKKGRMTVFSEGKTISRKKVYEASTRSAMLYNELVSEAERLLNAAKAMRGRTNKDIGRFTSQIRELIDKWKN